MSAWLIGLYVYTNSFQTPKLTLTKHNLNLKFISLKTQGDILKNLKSIDKKTIKGSCPEFETITINVSNPHI